MVEEPAHYTLHNHGVVNLNAYDNARRFPVTDSEWASVVYSPRYPMELGFLDIAREPDFKAQSAITIQTSGQTNTGAGWCLGALIAVPVAATNFAFECFANYELIGDSVRGKIPSEADPVGLAAVLNATRLQVPYLSHERGNVGGSALREAHASLQLQSKPGLN